MKTTILPRLPKTAPELIQLMEEIWVLKTTPIEDGGVILTGSELYWDWFNANEVADACGGQKLYSTKLHGEYAYHYDMPDGSRVAITTVGAAIATVNKHHPR